MAITSSLESYMAKIKKSQSSAKAVPSDLRGLTGRVLNAVTNLLTSCNAVRNVGPNGEICRANEALSFENLTSVCGVDKLEALMKECCIPAQFQTACMEHIALALSRGMKGAQEAWYAQSASMDHSNNAGAVRSLATMFPAEVVDSFNNAAPGQEAFGANIDMVVPDLKITLTTAIMNFHARIMPRLMPVRTVDQPNISFTKEYLEIFDNSKQDGKSVRLVDLYADPSFARNELQKIVPLEANDAAKQFVVKDGILAFGPQANLLKLSLRNDLPGYDKINRTDIIEENVKLEFVYLSLTDGSTTETFQIAVPESFNRLARTTNSHDSADRVADIKFRAKLFNNSLVAASGESWASATTQLLAGLTDEEFVALDIIVKPSINLKRGFVDCSASFSVKAGHNVDDALISNTTKTLVASLALPAGHALVGYTIDARFSEANLRKTNISVMSHRVPFSYDIPVGRNYTFDYAIGQVNAEENAANLTKVIGIGQDDLQLTALVKMLEDVFDRVNKYTVNPDNPMDYVGADFVAGDKIRPTIFLGNLDFSTLNVIRDADRFGDVKQKALSFLNGVMARIMQLSFLQQQLGGSTTATFRVVTSMEILSNVFAPEHIHNHMCKQDQRDLGDGVEYVIMLPNGVRLEFVTSTFDYMRDKFVMIPVIPGNAESELNCGVIASNGQLCAHYTPSGDAAHHRLFANIREQMIITAPIGAIINISGLDLISGIKETETIRPTIVTIQNSPYGA